ncbi:MAG: hypothetical protein ABI700_01920 [Chloroflexota bacterium]
MPEETRNAPPLTFADVIQKTQENLLTRGSLAPTVIAEGDHQRVMVKLEPIAPTYEGRSHQMFFLGLMLAQSGEVGVLQQVFFISEAWMSVRELGQPLEQPPSQDPQRQEVVIVAHHTLRPPTTEVVVFAMKRDAQGGVVGLEALDAQEKPSESEARSPLVEAFIIGFLGSTSTPDD